MNLIVDSPFRSPARARKIYVASSWRNHFQPKVVTVLQSAGHLVYDFRNPTPLNTGFSWSEIDPNWKHWTAEEYVAALDHPVAKRGFAHDMGGMRWADLFLLVMPCGRSAHLELGWACGQGKQTLILTADGHEPELMAKMCDGICTSLQEVVDIIGS